MLFKTSGAETGMEEVVFLVGTTMPASPYNQYDERYKWLKEVGKLSEARRSVLYLITFDPRARVMALTLGCRYLRHLLRSGLLVNKCRRPFPWKFDRRLV